MSMYNVLFGIVRHTDVYVEVSDVTDLNCNNKLINSENKWGLEKQFYIYVELL